MNSRMQLIKRIGKVFCFILVVSLVALPGCKQDNDSPGTVAVDEVKSEKPRNSAPTVQDGDLAQLVRGNTQFALDLYHQLRGSGGNLLLSL